MEDEEIKAKAVAKRLKRMKSALGWSVLIATFIDQMIASVMIGHTRMGLNLLLFGVIALVIYYWMKGPIVNGDTAHMAWRDRSPWLGLFWLMAGALIILLNLRYIGGQ